MKNIVYFCWLLYMAILLPSCQNNLKNDIEELRQELDMQRKLIEALQYGSTITDITYTDDGYVIVLSNNSWLIFDEAIPIVSRSENGTWLLNGKETGIPVDNTQNMPEIVIGENGNWFINGSDTKIQASIQESCVNSVVADGENIIFTFTDGTTVSLKLESEQSQTTNDICLPKYLYMLSDTRNDIYVEPFIRRWRPAIEFVRFTSGTPFLEQSERYVYIDKPKAWQTITATLYNQELEKLKSLTSIIRLGEKSVGDKEVYVQIIGDSYVQGAFFKDALLTKGYVPNIKMVGLRKVEGEVGQYDEGRGGDRLQDYFSIHTAPTKAYQGFMHPDGDYRYYGATAFWKNCHKVMNGDTGLAYTCGRFDDFAIRFDAETGFLLQPQKGDVQYDNNQNSFVMYDGNDWILVNKDDFSWSFNYTKYLEAWNLPKPQFVGEMLGLNDFRELPDADFTTWNQQIETMKNSYLEAVPDGKFMILIPCSTCGSMNNDSGTFTLLQNAAMWRLRKNIIDTFDNRESEGYYLVDVGITIDSENGYNKNENGVQTGNPHPYPNYPTMGIPIAAFIQYHREK